MSKRYHLSLDELIIIVGLLILFRLIPLMVSGDIDEPLMTVQHFLLNLIGINNFADLI